MRAGKMDRKITIQRSETSVDQYGREVNGTPVTVANLRAQLIQASTEEFLRDFGQSADAATIFRTRYVAGIKTSDAVIYEGETHDLVEIKEIGRRKGLELRTVARST